MRKLLYILTSVLLCSCGSLSVGDFAGEYEASVVCTLADANGSSSTNEPFSANVSIYQSGSQGYVHTFFCGVPDKDNEYHIVIPGKSTKTDNSDSESTLEPVTVPGSQVFIVNTIVYCLNGGDFIMPVPIKIKSVLADRISFSKSSTFYITRTDMNGNLLENVPCHYEYGDIYKEGNNLMWQVRFKYESKEVPMYIDYSVKMSK